MQTDKTQGKCENYGNLESETAPDWLTWLWCKHDRLSSFNRIGFWALLIIFTAMVSTISGAILTFIPAVDRAIISVLESSSLLGKDRLNVSRPRVYPRLARSVNLLVIEIEPTMWAENAARTAFAGNSRRIWLWQFQPQQTSITAIDIPRDSQVKIPGIGWGTIDDANIYGGTALISQIIGQIMGVSIDRYLRVTPKALDDLTTAISDKQTPSQTDKRLLELARHNFEQPKSIEEFAEIITQLKPQIDTNLSRIEIMSLTGFIGELPKDRFKIDLLPGYMPKPTIAGKTTPVFALNYRSIRDNLAQADNDETELFFDGETSHSQQEYNPFRHKHIVVQNTTDNPELGMKVLAFLARYDFQNVSLTNHLPLKLEQTKLVTQNDIQAVSYLQQILGMGKLELATSDPGGELTIRIGEDAESLTIEDSFVR